MSMDLYAWKGPIVSEDEACRLVDQGPSFHSPKELLVEPVRRDPAVLRQALIGLLIGVVLVVGGWMPLPVLSWIAIVIGVFMVVMAVYSVGAWLKE